MKLWNHNEHYYKSLKFKGLKIRRFLLIVSTSKLADIAHYLFGNLTFDLHLEAI